MLLYDDKTHLYLTNKCATPSCDTMFVEIHLVSAGMYFPMWIEWNCTLGSRWVISNLLSLADPPIAVIGETSYVMINFISSLRCAGSYSMTMVCKVKRTRTQTLWEVVYSPSVIQINGVYVHMCGMTEKRPAVCDVEISEKAPATMCSLNTWEQVGLSVNRPWLLCFSQF